MQRPVLFLCVFLFSLLVSVQCDLTRHSNIVALRGHVGNSIELFVRGQGNSLYVNSGVGSATRVKFSGWSKMSGADQITSHPAVGKMGSGRGIVFARGPDNRLHGSEELSPTNPLPSTERLAQWGPWLVLGEEGGDAMASMPIVGTLKDGRVVVLAINESSRVMYCVQTKQDQMSFGPWREIGKLPVPVRGLPQIVSTTDGELLVYVVGSNLKVYTTTVTEAYVWAPWTEFDRIEDAPKSGFLSVRAATTISGRVLLFGFDDRNQLLHTTQRVRDGHYWTAWNAFGPIHENANNHVISISVERNELTELISVVGKTSRNTLLIRRQDRETGWTRWLPLGGHVKRDPFLVCDGHLGEHVFAVGLDGVVVHKFLTTHGDAEWEALSGVLAD